ncbi:MAG: hypothetical protein JO155_00900, partial [Acidimicrobiia bacterium]|nr:hypothetical protein [Acidimicrobiia bacterium]
MKPSSEGAALQAELGWRMGKRVSVAHLVGAVFAVVSGALASANIPGKGIGLGRLDLIVFGIYLPISFLVCGWRSMRSYY